jgi:hypothetical protein
VPDPHTASSCPAAAEKATTHRCVLCVPCEHKHAPNLPSTHPSHHLLHTCTGFVVVHGAGSFGHFEASQYGITKPHTPQHTLLEGFAKTRRSVTRLNQLVVSALVDAGVPAVGLSPCGVCFSSKGALGPTWQQGYVDAVQALLSRCGAAATGNTALLVRDIGYAILDGCSVSLCLLELPGGRGVLTAGVCCNAMYDFIVACG